MCGCPCCDSQEMQTSERQQLTGFRFGPPPWAGFWRGGYGPTKADRKENLETLKKHLEEELAEVSKELGTL